MTITPLPLTHTIDGVVYTVHPVLIRAAAGIFLVDCGYEETMSVQGSVKSERLIQAENSLDSMPERARG